MIHRKAYWTRHHCTMPRTHRQTPAEGGKLAPNLESEPYTGLPYFDCAALIAIGSLYYVSELKSMGAKSCFCYCSVNIALNYKQ